MIMISPNNGENLLASLALHKKVTGRLEAETTEASTISIRSCAS
jgi:hypothetical protein